MNPKVFLTLLALAILLLSFTIFGSDQQTNSFHSSEVSPITGVDGADIKKILIQSGEDSVELVSDDDKWLVANRDNYKADSAKVNSLLLKLLSTQAAQLMPSSPEGLKQLGLEDGAEKQALSSKISLYGSELIAGILLGTMRSANSENPAHGPAQYVRQLNSQDVLILKSPIVVQAGPENWISTELINVLGKSFFKLESYVDGKLSYVIKRKDIADTKNEVFLDAQTPKGKSVKDAIVSQTSSSLENLGIIDAFAVTSDKVSKLSFDRESKFYLTNGLVYTVKTAEEDKSQYAKFSVSFDQTLVDEVTILAASTSSASSSSSSVSSSSSSSSAAPFSSEAEAIKLSQQHENWIYKLPEYSAAKFRKKLEDFFEDKTEKPKDEKAAE